MNRSVIQYLEEAANPNAKPGILSRVGTHLKNNWGKYALGGAALAGGALLANPALASRAAGAVGGAAQGGLNAVGTGAAQGGLNAVGTSAQKLGTAVNNAMGSVGRTVQNVAQKGQNLLNPGNLYNSWDKSIAQPALNNQAAKSLGGMNRFNAMFPTPQ